jgi:formamidopyrimidine-DNA glycosylase
LRSGDIAGAGRYRTAMPELPEVETTVRGLARFLDGETLARVTTRRGDLRRPFPPDLVQVLTGARVTGMGRRAKYGLIHVDRGQTMVFHLGMSGRWRIDPEELEKHDHLVLETGSGHRLALCDPRRFGSVDLVATAALEQWPPFAALGPEPLSDALTPGHLAASFKDRVAAIKLLLLDQRIVAGLGNIYVCEALHRARLSPKRRASTLAKANGEPRPGAEALAEAIQDVLKDAIANKHRYRGNDRFRVYDHEGERCPRRGCPGIIKRIVQAGRSTFFCPVCQR